MVRRYTLFVPKPRTQTVPLGPWLMPVGALPGSTTTLVMTPFTVMFATVLSPNAVNHRFPSGPVMIDSRVCKVVVKNVNCPVSVTLAIRWLNRSVSQMLPSGPAVIPSEASKLENLISLMAPAGVMRPILPIDPSVNQTLPSGPAVMSSGKEAVGVTNSVIAPCGVMRATLLAPDSVNHRLPSAPRAISMGWLFAVGIGKDRTRTPNGAEAAGRATAASSKAMATSTMGTSRMMERRRCRCMIDLPPGRTNDSSLVLRTGAPLGLRAGAAATPPTPLLRWSLHPLRPGHETRGGRSGYPGPNATRGGREVERCDARAEGRPGRRRVLPGRSPRPPGRARREERHPVVAAHRHRGGGVPVARPRGVAGSGARRLPGEPADHPPPAGRGGHR